MRFVLTEAAVLHLVVAAIASAPGLTPTVALEFFFSNLQAIVGVASQCQLRL